MLDGSSRQRGDGQDGQMTERGNEISRQIVTVAALAAVTSAFTFVMSDRYGFFDLDVYYGTLSSWVHGDGEIYDYLKPGTSYGFTYPPFAALVMLPLAYISWAVAVVVAATVSVLATALVLWWLVTPMARRQGWSRWYVFGLLGSLVVAFEPLRETIAFGQINMLLVLLVVTDFRWLVARDSRWAGVGIGLAGRTASTTASATSSGRRSLNVRARVVVPRPSSVSAR
jgi:alpha-1,2-mannosyltransferase